MDLGDNRYQDSPRARPESLVSSSDSENDSDSQSGTSAVLQSRGSLASPPYFTPANPDVESLARTNSTMSSPPRTDIHPHLHLESRASSLGSTSSLRNDLQWLHADELVALAQKQRPLVAPTDSYVVLVTKMLNRYLRYLTTTWARCLYSLVFLPSSLFDKFSMVAFAFFSSLILFCLMLSCMFLNLPYIVRRFNAWSAKHGGGLTMTNAAYPSIFRNTTANEPSVIAAREALARPMPPRGNIHDQESPRIFNLDVAKFMFQCAALMYERSSSPLLDALETTRNNFDAAAVKSPENSSVVPDIADPGRVLKEVVGTEAARAVSECLHLCNEEENEMTRFAAKLGMKYSTVSELNSQTSACAGLFWDPSSTYIILAFKGTEPGEFIEWTDDFTYEPRDAGDWIRGFGKVHGGFMNRIFPRKLGVGSRVPYYTIRDAVRHTAAHLLEKNPPGTKINLWLTGHSLGTAVASLVYARALNEPRDFGPRVVLRDAFMFGTPIICDVPSAHAFHNRLYHDERRTLWRITNAYDCVATALPDWGDDLRMTLSPSNLFSFAHLGVELQMHPAPRNKVIISGNAMPHGSPVFIETAVRQLDGGAATSASQEIEQARQKIAFLLKVPLLGRLVAHGTAPYWDELQRVQTGRVEWEDQ
ncbi:hypothetical protein PIIN_02120 [Serendipita indica DSM 11827]|uniref:Fungal lipase-type domain-containing protein n=1 Tax=Serendipita indica (strain DSM 11827) TaxID=1109443 RepID=G4TAB2_SERID|nr:hypothetical protein PIIN_02120 [Serendipita indica DSM 11827]